MTAKEILQRERRQREFNEERERLISMRRVSERIARDEQEIYGGKEDERD